MKLLLTEKVKHPTTKLTLLTLTMERRRGGRGQSSSSNNISNPFNSVMLAIGDIPPLQ
jgi:hypothetical protein